MPSQLRRKSTGASDLNINTLPVHQGLALLIPQGKVSTSGGKIHGVNVRNILLSDWEVRKHCTGRQMNLQEIRKTLCYN